MRCLNWKFAIREEEIKDDAIMKFILCYFLSKDSFLCEMSIGAKLWSRTRVQNNKLNFGNRKKQEKLS